MPDRPSHLTVRDNHAEHRFEIDLGGGERAIAEYRLESDTIAFTHTLVPSAHEGQGVGTALIRSALDSARRRGLKVIPACRFFAAYMRKHRDVQDLLTESERDKLDLG